MPRKRSNRRRASGVVGIEALPDELLAHVFSWLPCAVLRGAAPFVDRRWNAVAGDRSTVRGRPTCADTVDARSRKRGTRWCFVAASMGHVDCLAYARQRGRPWSAPVCAQAASGGHLDALAYLHEHGCPWDKRTCVEAAGGGHLDCLVFAVERGCHLTCQTFKAAVRAGHMDCIDYLGGVRPEFAALSGLFDLASCSGRVECMNRFGRFPFHASPRTLINVVKSGNVDCLHLLVDNKLASMPHPDIIGSGAAAAARHGHVECALLLVDVVLNRYVAPAHGITSMVYYVPATYFVKRVCTAAARGGHLGLLRLLRERGCAWDERTCAAAARGGHLDCLRYAHEQGCPWDRRTPMAAATGGHIECVRYAHESGCPWGPATMMAAARGGSLDIVAYARERGCTWNVRVMAEAAGARHLDVIRWLHENGCPWDIHACTAAAHADSVDCLRYLHDNGCPWDRRIVVAAARAGSVRALIYATANGLPNGCDDCVIAEGEGQSCGSCAWNAIVCRHELECLTSHRHRSDTEHLGVLAMSIGVAAVPTDTVRWICQFGLID